MLPFAWWGTGADDRVEVTQSLTSTLTVAATKNLIRSIFITRSASATFSDSLARSTISRTTAAKTLSSGLSVAATTGIVIHRFLTKSASAAFSESLAQSSESALPAAPSGLTANESIGTPPDVDLEWTDNADNEDNYAVQRRDLNGSWGGWNNLTITLAANTVTYTDTTTVTDKTYEYRVYATNSRGSSGFSNVVQITTGEA